MSNMSKNTLFKFTLTCSVLAISVSLGNLIYSCWWLDYLSKDFACALEYLLGIATAVALIFIWTKDMEISTETRTIKVIWDKHQDSDEPVLPDYIQIPANLPDEDVYLYLTKHYGYTPISWDNLK